MIGLDSNVLLRYLAQDDPIRSPEAMQWIERRLTAERPGFISLVTLAEVVWTLTTRYALSGFEIARVLEGLLAAPNLVVQNEGEVAAAMRALQTGRDFPRLPYRSSRSISRLLRDAYLRQKGISHARL